MDQYPFEFKVFMIAEDYLDFIDYLRENKKLKYLGDEADKQLDKQIDEF